MDNERSQWHSDDELASALERALEITQTGAIPIVQPAPTTVSTESIGDLFAALVDEPAERAAAATDQIDESLATAIVEAEAEAEARVGLEPRTDVSREQVFESLDDFKPRTNFIPIIQPVTEVVAPTTAPPTSAAVTMPVQWTPERPSFDEVVFGATAEAS
jgi:hypothetical protein